MAKDYYGILGVAKGTSQAQIKEAYRKLVLKYHPDVNKSDEAKTKMQEINEAYAVLGNEEKRKQYDTYGPDMFNRQYSQEDIFRGVNFEDIFRDIGFNVNFGGFGSEDLFGSFFGGQAQKRNVGQSILYRMDLSLDEIARGTKKKITIKHLKACSRCSGSGGEPGSKPAKCPKCKGVGYVSKQQRSMFGSINTVTTCEACGGAGTYYDKQCRTCSGKGGIVASENVEVSIPAGVTDGMRLRLEGMGDFGKDGNGDLYIEIRELKHHLFKRNGDNILAEVSVPYYTAILGGGITVPTLLHGTKEIEIEGGTQAGKRIFLRDEGIKRFNGSAIGDEIISINISIPKDLSKDEKDLIEKLKELGEEHKGTSKKKFGFF
jgi:molecular chaperone DnaJ